MKMGEVITEIPRLLDCGNGNFKIASSDCVESNKSNRAEKQKKKEVT